MFERTFTPPPPEVAQRETARRLAIIEQTMPALRPAVVAVLISGSMAYGQNYSVTEKSDIDAQILVTPETVGKLASCGLFDAEKLAKATDAYLHGPARQFSLIAVIDGVNLECHFWDKDAAIAASTMHSEHTLRIRSAMTPPAIDHSFSFDGSELERELPAWIEDGRIIAEFPSYKRENGKIFLARPVAAMLVNPLMPIGAELMQPVVNAAWRNVIAELGRATTHPVDLATHNVWNTLPGKSKTSPAARAAIEARTETELRNAGIPFTTAHG